MNALPILRTLLLIVIAGGGPLRTMHGQEPAAAAAPPKKLTVLIKPVKPFVFERGGATVGYSIELWRRVAQEAGFEFEFKPVATVPELIKGLQEKQADVGVGAISITAERDAVIDFSHSFYESGLQILAPVQGGSSILSAFKKLLTAENAKLFGALIVGLILISHLLWFLERRRNAESFPESYAAGVWEATWWSICTGITGGCENKAPLGVLGRVVAIVWMLAGMALVATVTANLTSTMTVDNLVSDIKSMADLQGKEVGSVSGTAAERYLAAKDSKIHGYPDVEAACRGLAAGEVKAVVYDAPILRYYLSENPGTKLQLVGEIFEKQKYGFALQQLSPLRKEINRALLKVAEEGFFEDLDKKWFTPAAP
ncbi:MAG: polar amino acid transport system substrate-binding protein [Chthoniobacter sp.]|nr:polar amino acid transport system substrate-binding protein [Chthoniobacter sp.]